MTRCFFVAMVAISATLSGQNASANADCRTSARARSLCTTDSLLSEATGHNDVATLARIYAPDYHFTTVRGTTAGRADQLRAFQSGEMHFDSATVSDRRIRIYDRAAVVTGRRDQLATVRGEARPSAVRFTHTYVWLDGAWRLVASQNTPIVIDPLAANDAPRRPPSRPAAAIVAGAWELVAFESHDSVGAAPAYPLGPHPRGLLIYDGQRVSVQLLDPDRPRFAGNDRSRGTDAEIRAAFAGSFSYYGHYDVDALQGTITHHVDGASFPNWVGTDLVRRFRLDRDAAGHDRLTLTTTPMSVDGQRLTTTLIWRRMP